MNGQWRMASETFFCPSSSAQGKLLTQCALGVSETVALCAVSDEQPASGSTDLILSLKGRDRSGHKGQNKLSTQFQADMVSNILQA